jgi:flagellar basal-body rod protein FlgB
MKSFDLRFDILAKSMSMRLQRHAALAGNIANADTPGYRAKNVSFENELQKAAASKNLSKIQNVKEHTALVDDHAPRPDGNSVSVDKQMALMTENTITYNATAEFLGRKLKMLKSVIQ